MFRATLNRRASSASICSAACPNRLRFTGIFELCPPAIHNGSTPRARASPSPFQILPKFWPKALQNPAPAAEIPERVRAGVLDSVRAHLLADVEVGIFLSAGVDSGALLGCMRDAGQREIRAITLAFEEFRGTPEDEAPLAARVCEHYGAHHVVRHLSQQEFVEDLPAILEAMDQPSIDGVNTWFVSKAAKEAGLKVAISGLGGDELLGGYPSFCGRAALAAPIRRARCRTGAWLSCAHGHRSCRARFLARTTQGARGCWNIRAAGRARISCVAACSCRNELPEVMDPEIAREGLRRLKPLRRLAASLEPDPSSDIARVCVLESAHYMRNQLLRDADWAGMAHSLEIRVPLVDFTLLGALAPAIPAITRGCRQSCARRSAHARRCQMRS